MICESFDAIIVGAGQAGPAIAARCSKEGLRTAVIERGHFGGTCLNVGCVPTKTLVASARAMHLARRGAEFGFDTGELRVDMARVKARKDGIVGKSREGLESWMRGLKDTEVIVGEARFVAAATLEVGGRRLTAPRIFLNVGGRSVRPDIPGIDTVPTLDNVSILELDRVPEHLVIVGGSYIGLEFAQMYRRFGAAVTVVEMGPRLIGPPLHVEVNHRDGEAAVWLELDDDAMESGRLWQGPLSIFRPAAGFGENFRPDFGFDFWRRIAFDRALAQPEVFHGIIKDFIQFCRAYADVWLDADRLVLGIGQVDIIIPFRWIRVHGEIGERVAFFAQLLAISDQLGVFGRVGSDRAARAVGRQPPAVAGDGADRRTLAGGQGRRRRAHRDGARGAGARI